MIIGENGMDVDRVYALVVGVLGPAPGGVEEGRGHPGGDCSGVCGYVKEATWKERYNFFLAEIQCSLKLK